MVTPELAKYIQDQQAAGYSIESIGKVLLANGWDPADVGQALSGLSPTVPKTRKSRSKILSLAILTLVLLGVAAGIYTYINHTGSLNSVADSGNKTYTDTGIQFLYDSSWKVVAGSSLVTGEFEEETSSDSTDTDHLFFTSDNYQTIKNEVAEFQALPSDDPNNFIQGFSLIISITHRGEFSLTRTEQVSAREVAQQATQSVCKGSTVNFSLSNPIVESQIKPVTIGKYTGFQVASTSDCDYKALNIFLDSNHTVATPTPEPIPGLTVTGISPLSSENDSFTLSFNNATDLDHLSASQKIIVDSLKFP